MRCKLSKALWRVRNRFVFRWWSWDNWRKGYQFRPIQRFRCCEHTTPFHYSWCAEALCDVADAARGTVAVDDMDRCPGCHGRVWTLLGCQCDYQDVRDALARLDGEEAT